MQISNVLNEIEKNYSELDKVINEINQEVHKNREDFSISRLKTSMDKKELLDKERKKLFEKFGVLYEKWLEDITVSFHKLTGQEK